MQFRERLRGSIGLAARYRMLEKTYAEYPDVLEAVRNIHLN